jgi:hypothetical protein
MPTTVTLVAIASHAPLLYLILATVLYLDISDERIIWLFRRPPMQPQLHNLLETFTPPAQQHAGA